MATEGTETVTEGAQTGDPSGAGKDTQKVDTTGEAKGQAKTVQHAVFGELDTDTAEWLSKREDIKDAKSLAKIARDKDSMVGKQAEQLAKAIIKPGKDATPEEKAAYRAKMDIGNNADDYVFTLPKDLPKELPYDGERAKSFAALATDIELTKTQAQRVHDWALKNGVDDFQGAGKAEEERQLAVAKAETEKLVKLYGPVTGEQFRANAAFADKVLQLGGEEVVKDLEDAKLIVEVEGGQKIVQRASILTLFAKIGQTLFKEGDLVKGDPTALGNPFADGEQENVTNQGRMIRDDRPRALAMIAAAGKKPSDFGLTA